MATQLDEPDSPEWSQEAFELATILDNEEAADVLDYIEDAKCPVSMPLPPNGRTLLHHYARLNECVSLSLSLSLSLLQDLRRPISTTRYVLTLSIARSTTRIKRCHDRAADREGSADRRPRR